MERGRGTLHPYTRISVEVRRSYLYDHHQNFILGDGSRFTETGYLSRRPAVQTLWEGSVRNTSCVTKASNFAKYFITP